MRQAEVRVDGQRAGVLTETEAGYVFEYDYVYDGRSVSLTMPVDARVHEFDRFPPFFDGLLPEGAQLEALVRQAKLDRTDYLGQLLTVGADLVGNVTVHPLDNPAAHSEEDG